MATLTGEQLKNSYQSLVTIGDTITTNPTSGVLENGKGNPITDITIGGNITIADKIIHSGDTNTAIRFPSADTVTIETAGLEAMRIDSSNNVGIGTTSPNTRLDVGTGVISLNSDLTSASSIPNASGQVAGEIRGYSDSGISSDNGFLRLSAGGGTNASEKSYIDLTGFFSASADRGTVRFGCGGSERMRIDRSGNVGIGTTSPAVELDVDGEIRAKDGILFGTDTATANALDDYEEGLHDATLTPATSGTITLDSSINALSYTKIGRIMHVTGQLSVTSVSSPTGAIKISLPTAIADLTDRAGRSTGSVLVTQSSSNIDDFVLNGVEGDDFVFMVKGGTTGGSDSAQEFSGDEFIILQFTYVSA